LPLPLRSSAASRRVATRELPFAWFQQDEVLRFAQFDLDWLGAGRRQGAGDSNMPLIARQPGEVN